MILGKLCQADLCISCALENPVNAMKEGTLNLGREVSFFVATSAVSSISMTVCLGKSN